MTLDEMDSRRGEIVGDQPVSSGLDDLRWRLEALDGRVSLLERRTTVSTFGDSGSPQEAPGAPEQHEARLRAMVGGDGFLWDDLGGHDRAAIRWALREIGRLREPFGRGMAARCLTLLRRIEWRGEGDGGRCPSCGRRKETGHWAGAWGTCPMDELIRDLTPDVGSGPDLTSNEIG